MYLTDTTPINRAINEIKTSNTEPLSLTVTCNRTLPDLRTIIDKNWHILQTEPKLKGIFAEPLILAFKRTKNLKDLIGCARFLITKKTERKII